MKIYYSKSPYIEKEQREKQVVYDLKNIPSDANVHSIPSNWIITEFDKAESFDKDKATYAVLDTTHKLGQKKIKFQQRTHNGFSDWIVVEVDGLQSLSSEEREHYIFTFWDKYVPIEYRKYVDEGFAKTQIKWVTIPGKEHWKKATKFEGKDWKEYIEEKILYTKYENEINRLDESLFDIKIEHKQGENDKGFVKGNRNNALFKKTIETIKKYNQEQKYPLPTKEVENILNSAKGYPSLNINNYMDNAERFWDKNPYFYDDEMKVFWMWDAKTFKYEMITDKKMMVLFDDILGFMGQTVPSTIKNNHLEAFCRVGIKKKPKDAPIKWVQFKDKAFSITSGDVHDVKPNYFFTNPIPWKIGETCDTPFLDKLFKEWVGEKHLNDLYEFIAYCCYRSYPIQLLFCLYGHGRNGKSTFINIVDKFLGTNNTCTTDLDMIAGKNKNRFETIRLYKKLACFMGETNFNILENSSILKKLVGGDKIGYEIKGAGLFDDVNYSKIIIASNSLPSSEDTSEGFYRRWHIIDFPNEFPEGKDVALNIPESEFSALAMKITLLLPKLLKMGKFSNQGTIQERKNKYIMASNPLPYFIKKYCYTNPDGYIRYSQFYKIYTQFLSKIKRRIVSKQEFSKILNAEGFEVRRTTKNNESDRYIEGVEINEKEIQNDSNDSNVTNNNSKKHHRGEIQNLTFESFESLPTPNVTEEAVFTDEELESQMDKLKDI